MKRFQVCPIWLAFLLVAGGLLALTGCQGLAPANSNGSNITVSNSSLEFGSVAVGNSKTLKETLSNPSTSSVTVSGASASGSGFSISGLTLPLTLSPNQSVSFSAVFAPTKAGSASGSIAIVSDAANSPLGASLSGMGQAEGSLTANPTSFAFGNIQVGTTSSQTETLSNTGGSGVTISAASATGSGVSLVGLTLPITLNAGQSTSFTVTFAPATTGAVNGDVVITSDGSNSSLSIPVSGKGVAAGTLGPNPASLSFGNVQVGHSADLFETLTNTGSSPVDISQANVTNSAFSLSGLTLPTTLNPSESVTFTTTFTPGSSGSANGNIKIVSSASNSNLSVSLSGTGTAAGQLSISPASLSFGAVAVGSASSLGATLTATGAPVTVSSATSSSGEFVVSGITLPATIPAGQSASFTVTFTPSASGSAKASITFAGDASNSPTAQTASGTGQTQSHAVGLAWNPSSGGVSYNIYRKLSTDPGYTQIYSGATTTSYTDSTVSSGDTYDYAVTAVDAESQESGYSNIAQVTVPNN